MSHRWRYRSAAALVFAAVVALLAACGGNGSSDTSEPLSKAEYQKQANQICKKGGKEKDQAVREGLEEIPPKELAGEATPANSRKLSEKALPAFEKVVTELGELTPPVKDKATVEDFMAELEAAAAKTEANPLLLAEGDPFGKGAAAARAYGLKDCAL